MAQPSRYARTTLAKLNKLNKPVPPFVQSLLDKYPTSEHERLYTHQKSVKMAKLRSLIDRLEPNRWVQQEGELEDAVQLKSSVEKEGYTRGGGVFLVYQSQMNHKELEKLRMAIRKLPFPQTLIPPSLSSSERLTNQTSLLPFQPLVIPPNLLRPTLDTSPSDGFRELSQYLVGTSWTVSSPVFSPSYLQALLRIVEINAPGSTKKNPAPSPFKYPSVSPAPVEAVNPKLALVGGVIQGRFFNPWQLRAIANLEELNIMQSQIVGLLSSPASHLAGVLGMGAGGQLARTIDGFRNGLEEQK